MNNKVLYIADYGRDGSEEDLSLVKIENYQAYEYFNKEWNEEPGLYSMLNDPGPWAEFVSDDLAIEIMKIIDSYD